MARSSKNQWDFGELFPAAETRKVWSVSDLTGSLKRSLEKEFASLWVSGEISNWRLQSSGHAYFVLKDAGAQLNCVLFRGQGGVDRAGLRDGARVTVGGDMTVYEPRGTYQLRVSSLELEGIGALQAAFEKLKAKLSAEGLFDPARKRPIPRYPGRVAVVTSPTGAALQDVLHVAERRFAGVEWILAPVRVQGIGSASEIVEAITLLNRLSETYPLDVILVTRGGGSIEDLWSFNEEMVARAIASSRVPVISAVGHEIDFTIADFVADLRAATPSAAAELLTEGFVQASGRVEAARVRIQLRLQRQLGQSREAERVLTARLARVHPRRMLEQQGQRLDDLSLLLARRLRSTGGPRRQALTSLVRRLSAVRPAQTLLRRQEVLVQLIARLRTSGRRRWTVFSEQLATQGSALRLLSPQQVLERGYSITLDASTGGVVRCADDLQPGQSITTRLASGSLHSTVTASESPGPAGR